MFVRLENKRKTLAEGSFSANGIETSYFRAGAGEVGFRFDDLIVGFSLNYIATHCGCYGSDVVREMPMHPGLIWMVPPGVDGQCSWNEANDFLMLRIPAQTIHERLGPSFADGLRAGIQVEDPMLVQMAVALHESGPAPQDYPLLYRDTIAAAILGRLMWRRETDRRAVEELVVDQRVQRAIDCIETDPAFGHSLDSLAEVAGMSQFHFARSFHAATGVTPGKFILHRRMALAKELLEMSRSPISEIACRVGYENVSHFARLFRKFAGATPGQIRLHRRDDVARVAMRT